MRRSCTRPKSSRGSRRLATRAVAGNDGAASTPTLDLRIPDRTLLPRRLARPPARGRRAAGADRSSWRATRRRAGAATAVFADAADRLLRAHARASRAERTAARSWRSRCADEIEARGSICVADRRVRHGGDRRARFSSRSADGCLRASRRRRWSGTIAHMRRFMADAAHELRTPLAVVRSRADVALQRPRDGERIRRGVGGHLARVRASRAHR